MEEGMTLEGISVTVPVEVSLVTQMLLLLSTAIPVGEVKPEKVLQGELEKEQDAAEMALVGISVTEPVEVSLVTQMLLLLSTAIPVGFEK